MNFSRNFCILFESDCHILSLGPAVCTEGEAEAKAKAEAKTEAEAEADAKAETEPGAGAEAEAGAKIVDLVGEKVDLLKKN